MKKPNILAPPRIGQGSSHENKWERERRAFLQLRPALLRSHRNKYVAIHHEKPVGSGKDEIALGLRVYAKYGYVPIYVGYVADEPERVVRIPSPRRVRSAR